ncbi:cilia- and flagella-associated protein 337 [Salminus brasiliensis]|uniref:cilia- and flagella-associated protein 337 n=1 Tax=Salminus brasiliensis TaxID=930266 RepID=UPI003B82F476
MDGRRSKGDPWSVHEEETPSRTIRYTDRSPGLHDSLQLHHLQLLRDSFSRQPSLSLEQLRSALTDVTGEEGWSDEIEELVSELDSSCDGGVGWEKLCTHVLQQSGQGDASPEAKHSGISSEPLIRPCRHNKREPVTRIVEVSQPPPLRYVTVSKGGTLTVWNSRLQVIRSLELCGGAGEQGGSARRYRGWITDAVYMPNVHKIAVASMSRDVHLIHVSTSACFKESHLSGLSHVATALCYWYNVEAPGERCVLIWGDERGAVNLLWFLQPLKGLFETPFSSQSGPQRVFLPDICGQTSLVSYQQTPKLHTEPINRIRYEPQAEVIVTSSESLTSSVVIMDVNQRRESYSWKIEKGVLCFDISWPLGLMVTAGLDPALRIWNRYVTSRPVAVLQGHRTTVVDVVIHQGLSKIFSYSKDAVLKIWDIPSQLCVKTLPLRFPNLQAGRILEQGGFPLLLSLAGAPALLVSCREYLALLRLENTPPTSTSGTSAFSCTLYVPTLKQVVTAWADSSVVVWDVDTGRKCVELRNAHGQAEITAMTADPSQRRLITAASNGTVKVWSLLNGHLLHKLEVVSDAEVTGVICLHDNQLLAVGWSRLVARYSIGGSHDMYVKADVSWKSGRLHSEDILASDHCPSKRLLATGSYDGEIIVWALDTQRPVTRLQRPQPGKVYPPVDRLLFLQKRAEDQQWRNAALLLSSQAGYVCWWSVCEPTHNHVQFYAPQREEECVKALRTNQDNSLLITGDTTGFIQLWDISEYGLSHREEAVSEQPPLVRSWRAHEGAIVGMEVLQRGRELFLVSASADRSACLWTSCGGCVGSFGQEGLWDLNGPRRHQDNRQLTSSSTEEDKDTREPNQSQNIKDLPDLTGWGQNSGGVARAMRGPDEDDGQQTESAPTPEDHQLPLQTPHRESRAAPLSSSISTKVRLHRGALAEHVSVELQRRTTVKQDRRQVFGDIDIAKLYRMGSECTPFQALKLPDWKQPEDVPSRPWMLSGSQCYSCATELSSPLLSSDSSALSGSPSN